MKDDIRSTERYGRLERLYAEGFRIGEGSFHAISSIAAQPGGTSILAAGELYGANRGMPIFRIAKVTSGATPQTLSDANERSPAWSSDGKQLAFLSDRGADGGVYQPFVADAGALDRPWLLPIPAGETAVDLTWSPDGRRLLVVTVGRGADAPGPSGLSSLGATRTDLPVWLPDIETETPSNLWRRGRVFDIAAGTSGELTAAAGWSLWDAAWCGNDAVLAVASTDPREGGWYNSKLVRIPLDGIEARILSTGIGQLACPASSPQGRWVAALVGCFHHVLECGRVTLHDLQAGGDGFRPEFPFEVSHIHWTGPTTLFAVGLDSLKTVAATLDVTTGAIDIAWSSEEGCGQKFPQAWPAEDGGFLCALEAHDKHPRIVHVDQHGEERLVGWCDDGASTIDRSCGILDRMSWSARDGQRIDGFLVKPQEEGPFPLVTYIHGGPVSAFRNVWSLAFPIIRAFLAEGYAVFLPNPRGSFGRSQEFTRAVMGDPGGEDAHDILRGIDSLVESGVADPRRLMACGRSYGGYMTAWLTTQSDRFAAACALSPISHLRSQSLTAHHPEFIAMLTGQSPFERDSIYDERSPIMYARNVDTPILNICGGADHTTPPSQALEFHRALLAAGKTTELATYPGEGHAVRRFEAQVDQATRILAWFEKHLAEQGTKAS
jgi:dipeptidyl aminopeptidase/acylaminoacyl peptidase